MVLNSTMCRLALMWQQKTCEWGCKGYLVSQWYHVSGIMSRSKLFCDCVLDKQLSLQMHKGHLHDTVFLLKCCLHYKYIWSLCSWRLLDHLVQSQLSPLVLQPPSVIIWNHLGFLSFSLPTPTPIYLKCQHLFFWNAFAVRYGETTGWSYMGRTFHFSHH